MYSEAFAKELWHGRPLPEYKHLKLPKNTPRQNVKSGGYVKESYQYAWWCVQNTDSFEEAVVTAFRGHDTDTSGAITDNWQQGFMALMETREFPIGCTMACMHISIWWSLFS